MAGLDWGGPTDFWWDYPRLLVKAVWDRQGPGRDAFIEAATVLKDIGHPNAVEGVAEVWGQLGADQPYKPGVSYLHTEGSLDLERKRLADHLISGASPDEVSEAWRLYESGATAFPGTKAHSGSKPWGARDPMHPSRVSQEASASRRAQNLDRAKFEGRSAVAKRDAADKALDELAQKHGFASYAEARDPGLIDEYSGEPTAKHTPEAEAEWRKSWRQLRDSAEHGLAQESRFSASDDIRSARRKEKEARWRKENPPDDPRIELNREVDAAVARKQQAKAEAEAYDAYIRARDEGPEAMEEYQKELRRSKKAKWDSQRGFVGNMGLAPSVAEDAAIYAPRRAAAKTALKGIGGGALGLGIDFLASYGDDSERPGKWDFFDALKREEENITQMVPGLVSPSELPPPAVLSDERRQAVTATQGMAGVGPDFESAPVTEQEIRAFVGNRMASGRPLPPWAEAITSRGPDGRVRVEPRVLRRPPQRPPPAAPQQSSVPMELRRR